MTTSTFDMLRDHFESISDDVGKALLAETNYEPHEDQDASDYLDELPLCVEVKRHLVIDLATGGPGIWLDAELDKDGTVLFVEYCSSWSGERLDRALDEDHPLWTLAERYAECVL